ncbi:HTTM domain-containing protein [Stieleria sp. JC731]|uniref:HTTM domain-containing protein n=1 Tax=Pirellulaceae TaxID=2691357 RepID=UPI001E31B761|nr:HTTM domain-containing protein [Stieleria sp. JC731]MCC9600307.1 HTTM domain-containing protein [Stieleria sp. JC731]
MPQKRASKKHARDYLAEFKALLSLPVDGASLAVFRICFGLVMAWHIGKFLIYTGSLRPLDLYYVNPPWHFTYLGFEWVRPLAEPWLSIHFGVAIIAALLVAAGLFYRTAAATLFLSYGYIFLLEATSYNNHYYLMCLLAFLLIFMPAATRFSIDNLVRSRWRKPQANSEAAATELPSGMIPFWPVFLLRFQLFIVYFYGGIAKINADWLTGEPLFAIGDQLRLTADRMVGLPDSVQTIHFCLLLAWGGLIFDLAIGFLLLWKRTRWLAITLTFLFHLHNHFMFPIGVFPTMAFTATLIFFAPDWPLRLTKRLAGFVWQAKDTLEPAKPASQTLPMQRYAFTLICLFLTWQSVWPLRHHFISGDANWTEEAQDFSWRMMLRSKAAGYLTYRVVDPQLHVVDERGRSQVDWQACSDDVPKAVYTSIDSHLFRWDHHPGLAVTFEPSLGTRVIYNSPNTGQATEESRSTEREKLSKLWRSAFGGEPKIEQTISLAEALQATRQRVREADFAERFGKSSVDAMLALVTELDQMLVARDQIESPSEVSQVALTNRLHQLYQSPLFPDLQPIFSRLHPFLLQGANFTGERFLVLSVPGSKTPLDRSSLLKLSGDAPYVVWIDFSRLRPVDWRGLPESFVTFEDRKLNVMWNHFHELNSHQLEQFTVRPRLIQQYARHIADRWESATGRRPEVRASSYIMLNYHFPRPLVDPQVDLAAVSYVPFKHNPWILPRSSERINVSKIQMPSSGMRR